MVFPRDQASFAFFTVARLYRVYLVTNSVHISNTCKARKLNKANLYSVHSYVFRLPTFIDSEENSLQNPEEILKQPVYAAR